MFDLLGDDIPVVRKNDRPEAAALVEVLKALSTHPAIAWCERMNSPFPIPAFRHGILQLSNLNNYIFKIIN